MLYEKCIYTKVTLGKHTFEQMHYKNIYRISISFFPLVKQEKLFTKYLNNVDINVQPYKNIG